MLFIGLTPGRFSGDAVGPFFGFPFQARLCLSSASLGSRRFFLRAASSRSLLLQFPLRLSRSVSLRLFGGGLLSVDLSLGFCFGFALSPLSSFALNLRDAILLGAPGRFLS